MAIVPTILFNAEEQAQVVHDAGRCGMPVSTYMRQKALGARPKVKDMTLLRNELAKLGGLLKHLHNEGLGHSAETAELLSKINVVIRNIDKKDDGEEFSRDSQNTQKT